MKVKELKLDQEVLINGHYYKYKGINKVREKGFGTVERVVFENKEFGDRHFDKKMMEHDLKIKNGEIIF